MSQRSSGPGPERDGAARARQGDARVGAFRESAGRADGAADPAHGGFAPRGVFRLAGLALLVALPLAGCGGDGTTPPPPPPPGPPPPPPPGASLNLELGELEALTSAEETRSFRLEASTEPREYLVAVHSAAQSPGSFSLQLHARGPDASGAGAAALPSTAGTGRAGPGRIPPELTDDLLHMRLRESMRRELERVRPRPARSGATRDRRAGSGQAPPGRFSVAGGAAVPQVGDSLDFNFAVQPDLNVSCTNATGVRAVVRAVGDRFVLVEDTLFTDGFSQAEWADLNVLLDDITFPVDSSYWGPPADIDGNDRAIVLFTAEVNKLTEPGSNTFIGGLFWPGDLAEATPISQGGCPTSNEAEIVYLAGPDPAGEFGARVDNERTRRNARSVTAHEFQHLLTAEQRVILGTGDFSDLEDAWLSEGFAHVAEEVVGFRVAGLETRRNLGIDEAAFSSEETAEAFNIHHLDNYFRLNFHLEAPHTTQAFGGTGGGDPGGEATLKMRGNAWIFLRWLADQYGPAAPEGIVGGSGEQLLFQELSSGGPGHLTGVPNILRAVQTVSGQTVSWGELLSDYEAALAVDDNGPPTVPGGIQVRTWDLRDMFLGLHEAEFTGGPNPFTRPYPLEPTVVAIGLTTDRTADFTLNAFTSRYFRFTSSGQPASELLVEVTSSAGTDVSSAAALQITVVRVQ